MRIAVISDTHLPKGTRALPEVCVERLQAADLILHGGDIVGEAFLEELVALGPPVEAVYGNMDAPALKALLPKELIVEAGEARIGMVHIPGPRAGREARLLARFPGCDAIVYGHTHVPEVERHVRLTAIDLQLQLQHVARFDTSAENERRSRSIRVLFDF